VVELTIIPFFKTNNMRTYQVVTAASTYPVTTSEAKTHLKVDTSADDTYIDNIIKAATQLSEEYTNRFFIDTVIEQTCSSFADLQTLFKSKVNTVTHVKYYDSDNSLQTLDATVYDTQLDYEPSQIQLAENQSFPDITKRNDAVVAKYTVGYGSAASDVPEVIKQAILLTIGNFYQNRNSVVIGRISTELPLNVKWLLNTYKVQIV
jgi:uncharacterized phiE125 gp8 family phage protein|tara:strand:+ start:68 stop:685 length:618 start_codon:yes stop_codon:yes gene_type:complete